MPNYRIDHDDHQHHNRNNSSREVDGASCRGGVRRWVLQYDVFAQSRENLPPAKLSVPKQIFSRGDDDSVLPKHSLPGGDKIADSRYVVQKEQQLQRCYIACTFIASQNTRCFRPRVMFRARNTLLMFMSTPRQRSPIIQYWMVCVHSGYGSPVPARHRDRSGRRCFWPHHKRIHTILDSTFSGPRGRERKEHYIGQASPTIQPSEHEKN